MDEPLDGLCHVPNILKNLLSSPLPREIRSHLTILGNKQDTENMGSVNDNPTFKTTTIQNGSLADNGTFLSVVTAVPALFGSLPLSQEEVEPTEWVVHPVR